MTALTLLCRKYQVRELSLFGSALRGELQPNRDLNLLVEFEPQTRVGSLTLSALSRELSALAHRPVDLVPKASLKSSIRGQALAEAQVLYTA